MKYDVLFRVDAGGKTGLGHLRRCMALAEGLKHCGMKRILFFTRTAGIVRQWVGKHYPVRSIRGASWDAELDQWKTLFQHFQIRMAFIDWYGLTLPFLTRLHLFVPRVLLVSDDADLGYYPVDAIINYNIYAPDLIYRASGGTKLFLGPKYALIRREILDLRTKRESKKVASRLFVSLGGCPSRHAVKRIDQALQPLNGSIEVVWGSRSPGRFADNMSRADLALSAAGVTSYELACLGVPTVLVILAENQRKIAEKFDRLGAARNLGRLERMGLAEIKAAVEELIQDRVQRRKMAKCARALVDGKGTERLCREIVEAFGRN